MADGILINFIFYSQKYGGSDTGLTLVCPSLAPELQSVVREGGFCQVLDQPIPLDRLILKNIDPIHVTGTPWVHLNVFKKAFSIHDVCRGLRIRHYLPTNHPQLHGVQKPQK